MALNKTQMANNIIDKINGLSVENKKNQQKIWEAICDGIIEHIKNKFEVKGIKVNIDNGVLASAFTSAAVVANDGGAALKTAMASSVAGNYAQGVQNNDGTGHVN